jgi:hypothetical protein
MGILNLLFFAVLVVFLAYFFNKQEKPIKPVVTGSNNIVKINSVSTTDLSVVLPNINMSIPLSKNSITLTVCEYFMFPNGTENTTITNCLVGGQINLINPINQAQFKVSLIADVPNIGKKLLLGKIVVYLLPINITSNIPITVSLAPDFVYDINNFESAAGQFAYFIGKINYQTPVTVSVTFTTNFNLNSPIQQFKSLPGQVDVVVIGGGVSGLQTATHLYNQGINVIVLEANNYLGGRNKPVSGLIQGDNITFDAGSEYIGSLQNEIFEYATEVYGDLFAEKLIDVFALTMGPGGNSTNYKNPQFVEDVFTINETYRYNDNIHLVPGVDGIPSNLAPWDFLPMVNNQNNQRD